MISAKKETLLHFTLYWSGRNEKIFPRDPDGDFKLYYENKEYIIRRRDLEHVKLLNNYLRQNPDIKAYHLNFAFKADLNAFDIMMKLIFGLKDVEVPTRYLVQVCFLAHALGNRYCFC